MNESALSGVSEQFLREARKLEVRLDDYLKKEEGFVSAMRACITQFKSLHSLIEELEEKPEADEIARALALKTKCETAFGKAIMRQGEAGHEGSHLLESYGALILVLQKLGDKLTADISSAEASAVQC